MTAIAPPTVQSGMQVQRCAAPLTPTNAAPEERECSSTIEIHHQRRSSDHRNNSWPTIGRHDEMVAWSRTGEMLQKDPETGPLITAI